MDDAEIGGLVRPPAGHSRTAGDHRALLPKELFMPRWLSAAMLVSLGAVFLNVPTPAARAQGGCRNARGDSPVARACQEGGVIAAKQTMRKLVREARNGGVHFECSDCHNDDDNYDRLVPDARDKFARLLAAARRK
jgi:hypothetical protein